MLGMPTYNSVERGRGHAKTMGKLRGLGSAAAVRQQLGLERVNGERRGFSPFRAGSSKQKNDERGALFLELDVASAASLSLSLSLSFLVFLLSPEGISVYVFTRKAFPEQLRRRCRSCSGAEA